MVEEWERLKLDYEQTLQTYRQLADIRFKLLAFVPTISGAAIALLAQTRIERWEKVVLAGLGLFVTLGIVLYDQRNTQFHNGAIGRARHLEEELRLVAFERDRHRGLFGSRRDHPKRYLFGLPVGHDLGLALIYSPVLGAWAFAAFQGGWPTHDAVAASAGVAVAGLALIQFQWHDGKPERFRDHWERSGQLVDVVGENGKSSHFKALRERIREVRKMRRDEDVLRELNIEIGVAESEGNRDFLSDVIAPVLAFRRASGAFVNRTDFLDEVKEGSTRRETEIESIDLLGRDRAVATCIVRVVDGDGSRRFHNVRLFVRSNEGAWKLLGWANEPT